MVPIIRKYDRAVIRPWRFYCIGRIAELCKQSRERTAGRTKVRQPRKPAAWVYGLPVEKYVRSLAHRVVIDPEPRRVFYPNRHYHFLALCQVDEDTMFPVRVRCSKLALGDRKLSRDRCRGFKRGRGVNVIVHKHVLRDPLTDFGRSMPYSC